MRARCGAGRDQVCLLSAALLPAAARQDRLARSERLPRQMKQHRQRWLPEPGCATLTVPVRELGAATIPQRVREVNGVNTTTCCHPISVLENALGTHDF